MKPAPFEYFAPTDEAEAIALLEEHGYDAKILAGGQSLIPSMNFRLAQPSVLVDINKIGPLGGIRRDGDDVIIGAMARHTELEHNELVAAELPLLHETMPWIAHPQIRNRGTLGGSLVHADPAAELPAVMLALGAEIVAVGSDGERVIPIDQFFTGMFGVSLEPAEIVREIRVRPQRPGTGWAFEEVARRHGDFALAGVAANVATDEDGICKSARIVLISVGGGPVVAEEAQGELQDAAPTEDTVTKAAGAAATEIDPPSDIHGSEAYRRRLVQVLTRRALERAFARCGDE